MSGRQLPWYKDGLEFTCTQCGRCCRGPTPGRVWVRGPEIKRLAEFFEISVDTFARKYLTRTGRRLSLIENARNDCVFWADDSGCQVYEVRPDQCRTYPFWSELVETREAWNEESIRCPGMDSGKHYSQEDIETVLQGQGETEAHDYSPKSWFPPQGEGSDS